MALNSDTIVDKIKQSLSKIHESDKLLTYGFIRNILLNEIPSEIINYCILYVFLRWNCWFKGGDHWLIEQYIAKRTDDVTHIETIYGDPLISKGKHEWKIKIKEKSTDIFIGISSNFNKYNKCFIGKQGDPFNYGYLSYAGIMNHKQRNSKDYPSTKKK
eukprot:549328_1